MCIRDRDYPAERGGSRLLVLSRESGEIHDAIFKDIGSYFRRGDLLVLNNTRVFPARLLGRRVPSGGAVECLLIGIPPANRQLPNDLDTKQSGGRESELSLIHISEPTRLLSISYAVFCL